MSRFKQYMNIINEMMDGDKNISVFLTNIEKTLNSKHVQNNHFSYGNSGSKFEGTVNDILEKIKQRLYTYESIKENDWEKFIKENTITTEFGPINGKWLNSQVLQMKLSSSIGYDYSMTAGEQANAENFFSENESLINELWKNIKEGLENAIPLVNEKGKLLYYLEKRNGNPHAKFLLKAREVDSKTSIINFIPGNNNNWNKPEEVTLFTIYPGIPPKKLDFTKPACLIIPLDAEKKIKNKPVIVEKKIS